MRCLFMFCLADGLSIICQLIEQPLRLEKEYTRRAEHQPVLEDVGELVAK